ncbi:hypothetical protein AA106555_0447 [Neokomagataea thailandica NBRC 106555]|nr:hypothetical protein AA106555_0447 [Neokomagataea thailandica NBRC 106555]
MSLWLQKTYGINAGRVQIIMDCIILTMSAFFLNFDKFILSVLSALAMSSVLIAYHKDGRYVAH